MMFFIVVSVIIVVSIAVVCGRDPDINHINSNITDDHD